MPIYLNKKEVGRGSPPLGMWAWLFGGLGCFGFGLGLVGGLWGFWALDEL